jgi:hypothetical protein
MSWDGYRYSVYVVRLSVSLQDTLSMAAEGRPLVQESNYGICVEFTLTPTVNGDLNSLKIISLEGVKDLQSASSTPPCTAVVKMTTYTLARESFVTNSTHAIQRKMGQPMGNCPTRYAAHFCSFPWWQILPGNSVT